MSKHTTPLPHADQTGPEAAEPALRASRFDERGIALQTVIIMVVLLAIAGTVAAVLFSRASDVTGELESQDATPTTIDTEAECEQYRMGTKYGVWAPPDTCTWTNVADASPAEVTERRCRQVNGTFADNGTGADTCTV